MPFDVTSYIIGLQNGGGEDLSDISGLISPSVQSDKTSIKNAINGLIGDANETTGATDTDMTSAVDRLIDGYGQGGGSVEHGVFFLDYDGSIVEAWDSTSVASKTALPANPTHTGLIAQGWNWDLQHIQSYVANYPNADVYVGQMYKTASGLTEMDITVTKTTGLTVICNMSGTKNWGDGTTDSSNSHTYTDYGNYTITCDGTTIPSGSTSSGGLFGGSGSNVNSYWCTAIKIGASVTSIGDFAFFVCSSLKTITIPQGVTSISDYAFYGCYSLFQYDFSSNTTIPTLTGVNVFKEINGICKILVPSALYDSWKTATNWTVYADYLYPV